MSEFELLRNITIGQYLPTGSAVHRLDPRVKLVVGALLMGAVMASASLVGAALALVVALASLVMARVPLRHALRGLRSAWAFFLMVCVLQLLLYPHHQAVAQGGVALWQWGRLLISEVGLRLLIVLLARLASLILLVSLLTFCTTLTELAHGIEHLLSPLQRVGLPSHELALVLTLALRFLPLLAREMERIMKAQAARGADFGAHSWSFLQRARRMLPLLVPLFLISLRRAEELIEAMEARCYTGGQRRTHLIELRAQTADIVALGAGVLSAALILATNL
jgi:energy-coupling factor transport system permease protein